MDILDNDVFKKESDRGVFRNGVLLYDDAYIPFYMNHDMFFYHDKTSYIFNIDKSINFKCELLHLLQITTQENFIICNDIDSIYVCDDDFHILNSYDMKNISNFVVFGHDVIFKHLHDNKLYCINLSTRELCEHKILFETKTDDVSGYINEQNECVVCDTVICRVPLIENFKFGGSKMRTSHVMQLHYSKYFTDETIDEIVTRKMADICNRVSNFTTVDGQILNLLDKHYLDNLIDSSIISERTDFTHNRVILTDNINKFTNDSLKTELENISMDLIIKKYTPVGLFYYYPPFHALNWHTNLESEADNRFRCYIVYCSCNFVSYFCYRHPYSHLIHIVGDKKEFMNIFDIGTIKTPLWHAIINPDKVSKRLSLGFLISVSQKDSLILRRRIIH